MLLQILPGPTFLGTDLSARSSTVLPSTWQSQSRSTHGLSLKGALLGTIVPLQLLENGPKTRFLKKGEAHMQGFNAGCTMPIQAALIWCLCTCTSPCARQFPDWAEVQPEITIDGSRTKGSSMRLPGEEVLIHWGSSPEIKR